MVGKESCYCSLFYCVGESDIFSYFRTKETCCQCEKDIDEEAPVILPCRHIVCEHCLIDLLESAENNCPNCNKKISQDYDRTKTVGNMR